MRCSPHLEMEAGTNDVTELSGTDRENIRKQTFLTVAHVASEHCQVDGISNPRHIHPFTHTSKHFRGITCCLGEQNNSHRIQLSSTAALTTQTHMMKVWFHIGFRVCFFISVLKSLSSEAASCTTDLEGLALERRVRLSSSSSRMVSRQYGSLKPGTQSSTGELETGQRQQYQRE